MRYLLILIILSSCGPAHKLRKAERLMNEAIAMGATVKTDTVKIEKNVFVKGDTVKLEIPVWSKVRDTVIYKDRAVLRIVHHNDTIRLSAECLPDTIKVEVPVTVHKSIICPKDNFWKGVGYGAGGLLILLIIWGVLRLIKG